MRQCTPHTEVGVTALARVEKTTRMQDIIQIGPERMMQVAAGRCILDNSVMKVSLQMKARTYSVRNCAANCNHLILMFGIHVRAFRFALTLI